MSKDLPRRLRALQRLLRDRGPAGVSFRVAQLVFRDPWGHVEWFYVLETVESPAPDRIAPVWVTDGESEAVASLASLGRPLPELRRRLLCGDLAATAWEDDALVAYVWVRTDSEYDEAGLRFEIRPDEAWIYDAMTHPEHRGRRIYPRLFLGMARDLGARGRTRLLSTIDHLNEPSLRASEARGARRLGTVMLLRVFSCTLVRIRWRDAAPEWRLFRGASTIVVP